MCTMWFNFCFFLMYLSFDKIVCYWITVYSEAVDQSHDGNVNQILENQQVCCYAQVMQ